MTTSPPVRVGLVGGGVVAPDLDLSAGELAIILVLAAVVLAGLVLAVVTVIRAIVRPRDW